MSKLTQKLYAASNLSEYDHVLISDSQNGQKCTSEESHAERERADFVSRPLIEFTWSGAAIYSSAAWETYAGEWGDCVAALEDCRPPSLKSCSDSEVELQAWKNKKSI